MLYIYNVIKIMDMKKTVNYNQENIKVEFETLNFTRIVDRMDGIRIADAHGTKDFIINNKTYKTEWGMKYNKSHSTQLHFEGFTCGDSEKKMIEHIISKYGI
jgi:hypothetical protein